MILVGNSKGGGKVFFSHHVGRASKATITRRIVTKTGFTWEFLSERGTSIYPWEGMFSTWLGYTRAGVD